MDKNEQNGYCPTCKTPQDRIALCDKCAGRRDGANMNDSGIGGTRPNNHSEVEVQNKIKKLTQ